MYMKLIWLAALGESRQNVICTLPLFALGYKKSAVSWFGRPQTRLMHMISVVLKRLLYFIRGRDEKGTDI